MKIHPDWHIKAITNLQKGVNRRSTCRSESRATLAPTYIERIGMSPLILPNYNKWSKPPTAVYEDNYGYGINFYQPMIDYINRKERGYYGKPPHLPWNNELGLEKYRHDRPVHCYTPEDLRRLSSEVSVQARKRLDDFRVARRSAFSVVSTAAAANITKHVIPDTRQSDAKKRLLERLERRLSASRERDVKRIERNIKEYENQVTALASLRRSANEFRGKSAKTIAQTLLQQTYRNIEDSHERRRFLYY